MPGNELPFAAAQELRPRPHPSHVGAAPDLLQHAGRPVAASRERPIPRERAAVGADRVSADELALVMREIAESMSARCAILTLHPSDGRRSRVIHAEEEAGVGLDVAERLIGSGVIVPSAEEGALRWVAQEVDDRWRQILLVPVQRVDGHSGLVISVFFDDPSADQRAAAEQAYLGRRPFAIGYFRLWQLERTRKHRIAALQSAINLTEVGVLLLDRTGALVFGNDAGEQILAAGDGLRRRQRSVHAGNLREDIRLQVAIEHVIGANGPEADGSREKRAPIMSITRASKCPLILSVLPTSEAAEEPSDVAAIVYVLDPALDAVQMLEPVCKIYQLTPVETKLACQLAGGATLAAAAAAMRVKEQTARSCLKQVFLKTGTNRQADLVRVMLSSLVRTTRAIPTEVI